MPYQIGYGNPFATPGVAGGLFQGARDQTEFTRSVERTKLALEARRVDIQAAQVAASRSAAEITARQVQRQLDDRAREWRAENRRKAEEQRIRRAQERRLRDQAQLDYRVELRKLSAAAAERQAKAGEAARDEANALAERGARPLDRSQGLLPGEVPYQAMDGRTYAVRDKDTADLDKLQSELRLRAGEEARSAAYSEPQKRILANLDREVSTLMQRRGQAVTEQTGLREELATLRGQILAEVGADGKPLPAYVEQNKATRKAIAALEAKIQGIDPTAIDRRLEVLQLYRQAATRNPAALDLVTPEDLARIDWSKVTSEQFSALSQVLWNPAHPAAQAFVRELLATRHK